MKLIVTNRRMALRLTLILASTLASTALVSAANPPNVTSTQLDTRTISAMQSLQRYGSSHSFEDLRSALYTMESAADIGSLTPSNFIVERRTLVRGWARILKAVEQSYDPTFDPSNANDLPNSCVVPPREPSGRQAPACADPSDVKDPQSRAQYIAAIRANDLRRQRTNRYRQLFNIDEAAMSSLEMALQLFNKVAPDNASPDFAALDDILKQAGLGDARRQTLDAWIYRRSGP